MASDWPLLTVGRYSEVVVRTGLTVYEKYTKGDQRGEKEGEDNGADNGRGVGWGGHMSVNEFGKLGVGDGFIGEPANVGNVGMELLELAIEVG